MGLFRSVTDLFRGKTGKDREKPAAELPPEQTETVAELPKERPEPAAEVSKEQTETLQAQPKAAPRKPKYEARPNPDKEGWGRALGQEIFKVPEDRASQE